MNIDMLDDYTTNFGCGEPIMVIQDYEEGK